VLWPLFFLWILFNCCFVSQSNWLMFKHVIVLKEKTSTASTRFLGKNSRQEGILNRALQLHYLLLLPSISLLSIFLSTECVTDLDLRRELLFLSWFWPLLNRALFLEAAGAVLKIGSSLKPNHHWENLACPNMWNTLYLYHTHTCVYTQHTILFFCYVFTFVFICEIFCLGRVR